MELFFGQKNFDVSIFLPVLDNMIAYNNDNIAKVEQAYMLKTECLFKLKKKEEATKNNLLLAKYYLDFAEGIFQNDIQGALRCVNYYQKGIKLYRDNGEPQKAEIAHKRLVEIQKEIPQIMVPFSIELDIKGVVDNIKINMEGLTWRIQRSSISSYVWKKFDKCTRTDRVGFATSGYTKSRERSTFFGVTYVSECIRKTKNFW